MKEYGGYIEFEHYFGEEYHKNVVALNCGRNCLAYLIDKKKIRKIYLPYFLCDSVSKVCIQRGVEVEYYQINTKFQPVFEGKLIEQEGYIYVVNFYGQLTKQYLLELKNKYNRIIFDYAQSFFERSLEKADTIYVPRKFFGVADGAYLSTECKDFDDYPCDFSSEKMDFLLGRFEGAASQYYEQYKKNNEKFDSEPIKRMSELTHNLLRGIDYAKIKEKREQNFKYLNNRLQDLNELDLNVPVGPFAYPLYVKNGYELRKKLQQEKIYIPTLWPNVLEERCCSSLEYSYANDILPLPVDQRYGIEDMEYIVERIQKII